MAELRQARERAGMTQQELSRRLGVSQAYWSMVEAGRRPLSDRLALRVAEILPLRPTLLPLPAEPETVPGAATSESLAHGLAALGYPGFSHLRSGERKNPAGLLLTALRQPDLEVRVIEGLPWLALEYHDLDWSWAVRMAKLAEVQNRLGYVVQLARRVAEQRDPASRAAEVLRHVEAQLDAARLTREETLCQEQGLTRAQRRWLLEHRPAEAIHWNLLTDLRTTDLNHV